MTTKSRSTKRPAKLTVDLNCIYPRWICSVSDNIGTANGGFWRGFRTHAEMWAWLAKNRYECVTPVIEFEHVAV